tara:strand:- start:526 stop:783 length:258 start_codon:yes stop_codon:yes gene_type:complete
MEVILVIGQTEPDDTLDSMKKHGLEFNVVSSDTNAEDAFTEVVVNVLDVENFIKKTQLAFENDKMYELSLLNTILDIENNEIWSQ